MRQITITEDDEGRITVKQIGVTSGWDALMVLEMGRYVVIRQIDKMFEDGDQLEESVLTERT